MSDQDKEIEIAKDPDLVEMGLEDPKDDNWEREDPYDYMPYLVSHPKGSAREIEAAL